MMIQIYKEQLDLINASNFPNKDRLAVYAYCINTKRNIALDKNHRTNFSITFKDMRKYFAMDNECRDYKEFFIKNNIVKIYRNHSSGKVAFYTLCNCDELVNVEIISKTAKKSYKKFNKDVVKKTPFKKKNVKTYKILKEEKIIKKDKEVLLDPITKTKTFDNCDVDIETYNKFIDEVSEVGCDIDLPIEKTSEEIKENFEDFLVLKDLDDIINSMSD